MTFFPDNVSAIADVLAKAGVDVIQRNQLMTQIRAAVNHAGTTKINKLEAAFERDSWLTRECVASCARIGVEIPETGITAENFDRQVRRDRTNNLQTMSLKTTLSRLGLMIG